MSETGPNTPRSSFLGETPIESSPEASPMSSPPGSPSLLSKINENDDFAVSSDSDVWSLGSDSRDVGSFAISSDSYFSQHRDSFGELRGRTKFETSGKGRRISDVSIRSTSDFIDSDSDLTKTPSRQGRRRSSSKRRSATSRSRNRDDTAGTGASAGSEISQTAKIFKNLLIVEESLRQQNAEQKQLRRKYLSFLMSMSLVLALTGYRLMAVSDTGYIRFGTQIVFIIDLVTLLLFYLSGEYHRTVTRPRKFLAVTNKGLRQLNVRLVKVRVGLWDQTVDALTRCFLLPVRLLKLQMLYLLRLAQWSYLVRVRNWLIELEIKLQTSRQSGGVTDVKVVLNPRVFYTDTREQWELYRNEFWNKETMRRRKLLEREKKETT